jgi:hypothetical protein
VFYALIPKAQPLVRRNKWNKRFVSKKPKWEKWPYTRKAGFEEIRHKTLEKKTAKVSSKH